MNNSYKSHQSHFQSSIPLNCHSGSDSSSSSDPISGSDSGLSESKLLSEGGFSTVILSNITGGVKGSSADAEGCATSVIC